MQTVQPIILLVTNTSADPDFKKGIQLFNSATMFYKEKQENYHIESPVENVSYESICEMLNNGAPPFAISRVIFTIVKGNFQKFSDEIIDNLAEEYEDYGIIITKRSLSNEGEPVTKKTILPVLKDQFQKGIVVSDEPFNLSAYFGLNIENILAGTTLQIMLFPLAEIDLKNVVK